MNPIFHHSRPARPSPSPPPPGASPAPPRQVVLVTGASRGIGRAIALRLADEGAAVAVGFHRRADLAAEVVGEIERRGGAALAVAGDVSEPAAAEALVQATVARFGRLDGLVLNAGVASYRLLIDTPVDEWDRVVAVHLRGSYLCSRAALPHMLRQGGGRIVAIASVWGQIGAAGEVAYSAAKAGMIGFVRALAREVGRGGVTVNAVSPGAVDTDMIAHLTADERRDLAEQTPAGRIGEPGDVAAAVAFLLRSEAGYINGQVIGVNGGTV